MKVLIINGSPRKDGNCKRLLTEAISIFEDEKVDYEVFDIGSKAFRGCIACGGCAEKGRCVFDDGVNELAEKFAECDGLMIASPVYYASANGTLIALLDRMFFSCKCDKRMKVGAAFAVARRAGTTATFDELNKYFTINQMPIASGRYWNDGFGREKGQIDLDEEGKQNARIVARNMVFLMRSIELGKQKYGLPQAEQTIFTNFIK